MQLVPAHTIYCIFYGKSVRCRTSPFVDRAVSGMPLLFRDEARPLCLSLGFEDSKACLTRDDSGLEKIIDVSADSIRSRKATVL